MIAGTEAQKQQWLGAARKEFCFVSYACSEPDAGSDVAGMKTPIVRDGDDWRLTGQKRWITNAGHASFFTGFATMDPAPAPQGHHRLRRPRRPAGRLDRPQGGQARPARQRHARRHLRGRAAHRRPDPRQARRRLFDRHGDLRPLAADDRRAAPRASSAAAPRSRGRTRSSARRSACPSRSTRRCSS